MMKYLLFAAATILTAGVAGSCSNDDKTGTGDTTIGFAQANYVFKENAGLVKIPLAIAGKSPVSFDVKVELEGTAALEEVALFTQTAGMHYAGDEEVPVIIEFKSVDNDVIDASRFMTLTLTSVSGGKVSQATTRVEITDDDNNPYDRLQGDWVVSCVDSGLAAASFPVNISGGFTPDEQTANAEKQLVCWGFGPEKGQSNKGLSHQPIWYMQFDGAAKTLTVKAGTLMADAYGFTGIEEDCIVKCLVYEYVGGEQPLSISETGSITATYDDQIKRIVFPENYGVVAGVYGASSGTFYGIWYAYHNLTMTRK